jgi:hypothetical protein
MQEFTSKEKYIKDNFQDYMEKYDISFDREFDVEYMLGLRYDLLNTSDNHTKAKMDLAKIYHEFSSKLNLKPKLKENMLSNSKVLILTKAGSVQVAANYIKDMCDYGDNLTSFVSGYSEATIKTKQIEYTIQGEDKIDTTLKGKRFDHVIKLLEDRELTRKFLRK